MKYSDLIYFILLILLSCQTKEKKAVKHNNELTKKFKPFLHGTWVPVDYINDIVKTKSPLASSKEITSISEFSIDTTGLLEDSIDIGAAIGNHEGGYFVLYFKQGATSTSLLTNIDTYDDGHSSYELGYVISSGDTSLVLYYYDKNKKLLGETKYIKVRTTNPNDDLGDGFQYMVNKKLVAGVYYVSDSADSETKVELTADGKIKGLWSFKTYYIITDFVAEPGSTADKICFEIQTKDQKCYGFKIIADTINLFEFAKDTLDTSFKPGPTIYKLVKQK